MRIAAFFVIFAFSSNASILVPLKASGFAGVVKSSGKTLFVPIAQMGPPPPHVVSISPTSGPTAGSTNVTITGTDFVSGAEATIGGVSITSTNVVNATTMTGTTGAHAAGVVDVVVSNPDTQTGTLSNGFTYEPAFTNTKSLSLNGTSQYVTVGTGLNATFNRNSAFSFSGWFKKVGSSGYYIFYGNQDPANGYKGTTLLYHNGISALGMQIIGQGGGLVYVTATGSGNSVSSDVWHHLALTFSGNSNASGVKMYVDGVETGYTVQNNNLSADAVSAVALHLGADPSGSYFSGKLDEMAFFSRAISGAEVTTIYNSGVPNDISGMSGLISYYRFENNAQDSVGSNHGTLVNSPTYSTDIP